MVGRRSDGSRKGEEGEAGELADGVLLESFCAAGKEKRPTHGVVLAWTDGDVASSQRRKICSYLAIGDTKTCKSFTGSRKKFTYS